jgi:predicted RNase H-like nuclease (RuvC/YqgF family)
MSMKRPFSEADWQATPEPVRRYVESLEQRIEQLETTAELLLKRVEQLESQLKQNSQNSNMGIPDEAGHRFRTKAATDSDARRPPRLGPFTELKATLVKPSSSR